MAVHQIFSDSFYKLEHKESVAYTIDDRTICQVPDRKKTLIEKVTAFFLGKLADPAFLEVVRAVTYLQKENAALQALETEIHDKGFGPSISLRANFSDMAFQITLAQPTKWNLLCLRIVNLFRSVFKLDPIIVPEFPHFPIKDEPISSTITRGLESRQGDASRCLYSCELLSPGGLEKSQESFQQNLNRLELGLDREFCIPFDYFHVENKIETIGKEDMDQPPHFGQDLSYPLTMSLVYDAQQKVFSLKLNAPYLFPQVCVECNQSNDHQFRQSITIHGILEGEKPVTLGLTRLITFKADPKISSLSLIEETPVLLKPEVIYTISQVHEYPGSDEKNKKYNQIQFVLHKR